MGRRNLRDRVASIFELPGDVMMDMSRITLLGDAELLIENHRGLFEYTNERLVISTPKGRLAILGSDLSIGSISPDQVTVAGKIRVMQYID